MSRRGGRTPPPLRRGPRSRIRYRLTRAASTVLVRVLFRLRVEDVERLPSGAAILCFNHLSWADPFVAMAALPWFPRLSFFGPKEEDMARGARNRLMTWTGTAIPYRPAKDDLLEATRRVGAVMGSGEWLAIAGEGRIHIGERELLPLSDGPAFFALRSGVPIVPLAINGTSWLGLGRRLRVRVGVPIEPVGGARRDAVDALTAAVTTALRGLVADAPEPPPPGRFGRWLTERFNDWPEGTRPAGPDAFEPPPRDPPESARPSS
ncbi:MAG TPA: lysophospholipid acyltransferase family protein [Candidatus Limnocylindrales bacterium]|nr:lysophospholipid acyltransferase family protein [Candidatus Limnocylindrales bacterium]